MQKQPVVVTIDLTGSPPSSPGKGKEEEEEEEQQTETGMATKNQLDSVRDEIAHLRKYMERMFGVAISYPQNATKMAAKGETIDWARGYGPTRLMEEIQFSEAGAPKYGGFDLHKDNDNDSARVNYVFKLPEARDKVLCVPYYLLAEQVQKDAYFIRYLNERLLPILDDVCTDVSILSRAILGHNWVQASLRKADQVLTRPETRLTLNIPPVVFPVTPTAPRMVNKNVDTEARKAEVRTQTARLAYRKQVADAAEEVVRGREKFRDDEVERLKRSGAVTFSGQPSGGGLAPGKGAAGQRAAVGNLPANWNALSPDDKIEELASKFYYVSSQLEIANARCGKLEKEVASAELQIGSLQTQVDFLKEKEANPFSNSNLFGNNDDFPFL